MFTNDKLRCVLVLAIHLGTVFTYNQSEIIIVAYKPKGVSVRIPYEKSIKEIKFYGKLAPNGNGTKPVAFRLTDFKKYTNHLVALDENVMLHEGILQYTLEKNGRGHFEYTHSKKIVLEDYPFSITAYDPQGFRITLLNNTGVEGFLFWANLNEPLLRTKHAVLRLSALEPTEGDWIAENQKFKFLVNDFVYPVLYIRRNGQLYRYFYLPPTKITALLPYLFDIPQIETISKPTTSPDISTTQLTSTEETTASNPKETAVSAITATSEDGELLATSASTPITYSPISSEDHTKRTTQSTTLFDKNPETTTVFSYAFEFYKTSVITSSTKMYYLPNPKIEVTIFAGLPKGLILYLTSSKEIDEFNFWANINTKLENINNADIKLSAFEKVNGMWAVIDDNVPLKMADVLYYAVYTKRGNTSYFYTNKQYIIKDLVSIKSDMFARFTTRREKVSTTAKPN